MPEINKLTSNNYPDGLKQLPQPPKQLFVAGELAPLLTNPCVAIVGSRKVSRYGREVTEKFASSLARAGVTIISGLALGVDSIAHQACLDAGGKTLAVLPTPLAEIVPTSHRPLAKAILASGGALVSEYPSGTIINRAYFVARNRIVAALANAVVITEAALKSGSLHTARYALELGREVLAVPGPITSPTSEGTNNLIKRGALIATSADDVLFALGLATSASKKQRPKGATASEQLILDLISDGTSDGAELLASSGLNASEFNQTLTMLELNAQIRSLGANHWTL